MATQALDLMDPSAPPVCNSSKEEAESMGLVDDSNNNAQEKVLPRLSVFQERGTFPKDGGVQSEDSEHSLTPGEDGERKNDGVRDSAPRLTITNPDDLPGSSRNPTSPNFDSMPVKDEGRIGKGFSNYFFQVAGASGSKTTAASGGAVKQELEGIAKSFSEELRQSFAVDTKPVQSLSASVDVPVVGRLPSLFEADGSGGKNRQKSGNGATQVKPRCTPAREAVDPAKYFTLTDEPDGTKYACSKCGNVYKWRKSLNKHWKEKHDGETPSLLSRPPPSLLQRERFLNPLRGAPKHSIYHQPSFHGTNPHPKSSAPVASPPKLHAMHGGKNPQGLSYIFSKFPMKDESRDVGKMIRQIEEPVTAVVRPNRSGQSPIPLSGWSSWLPSSNKSQVDFPSPAKLKIPAVESIKSAHSQLQNGHGRAFSAIHSHHAFRGGPLDLSGTLVSASVSSDDNILDLSCKNSQVLSSAEKGAAAIQDEPLDFSLKPGTIKHLGHPKGTDARATSSSSFSLGWLSAMDRKDANQKGIGLLDGCVDSQGSPFSVINFEKPNQQVACASCHLIFKTILELNHHFARTHLDVIHETALDLTSSNNQVGMAQGGNGGNQLYRCLTMDRSKRQLACIVCGMTVQWSWMLSKHFEQMHSSIQPNPYKKTSAVSSASGASPSVESGAHSSVSIPTNHCDSCPFSTDSMTEFVCHQMKHTLAKERRDRELRNTGYGQLCDGDQEKDLFLKPTDESPFKQFADGIIDLEGESTAIVIPEAPEEISLECLSRNKPKTDASSSNDVPSMYSDLSFEGGVMISGENTAIVIPQAPEETSLGSSQVYLTPPGLKSSRGKKETGSSAESLLPFKCDLCEYRARWPSEMMQHMKNHSDEKPYQCPQCTYRSKWKWDVVKHLKRCGGGGSVKDVIDTTQKKKSYVKSLLIDSHSHHSSYDGSLSYGTLNFSGLYDQPSCSKARESLSKGPPNVTVYSMAGDSPTGMENYDNCDSDDANSEDMSTSKMEQGGDTGQSVHGCPQCPFMGHSPAELKRHLRVHSDEKPYTCQTCCYSSKWKCDLKKHLKAYNHVSAVPLIYGGHGRKPTMWCPIGTDQQSSTRSLDGEGKADGDESDVRAMLQAGSHGKRVLGLDRASSHDGGNLFGGITSGGRLKCRQCEFEAIDITSFLQHKKIHRNLNSLVKKHDGNTIKAKSLMVPLRHRRKSFKQTRVPQIPAADSLLKSTLKMDNREALALEEVSAQGRRFWESLGLQSTSSAVNFGRQSSVDDSDENFDDQDTSDPEIDSAHYRSSSKRIRYDSPVDPDLSKQSSRASTNSYESTTDTEVEYMDTSEQNYTMARTRADGDLEDIEEAVKDDKVKSREMKVVARPSAFPKLPFPLVRRGIRQGVTTTEAEDAAGMSKRKRKLRTCEKCGYITDNLTTLQRHAAKHGSGGRHRCWKCDYSVDRQHVLDYHIKIVHEGAGRELESKKEGSCGSKMQKLDGDEKKSFGNSPLAHQSSEKYAGMTRKSFSGKRKIVCTTSVIMVRGHEMEMIQKGNKTWYNCIKCHFVSSNITNAVNHAKQHGANKKYRCKFCDYSLDRKSSIANHMNSQHSDSGIFQFDLEAGKGNKKSGDGRWTVGLHGKESLHPNFRLLDKMNVCWRRDVCIKCGFCSLNSVQMLLHRLKHGYLDKMFGCSICGSRFTLYRSIVYHMKRHEASCSQPLHETDSTVSDGNEQVPHSDVDGSIGCGRYSEYLEISKEQTELQNMAEECAKIWSPARNFSCPFCPFVTFSAQSLLIHTRHHNSVKKFPCGECTFRANVRNVLYHHQKLHR